MKRATRERHLTVEEAAEYNAIRKMGSTLAAIHAAANAHSNTPRS